VAVELDCVDCEHGNVQMDLFFSSGRNEEDDEQENVPKENREGNKTSIIHK
jgi:hypothetical protein